MKHLPTYFECSGAGTVLRRITNLLRPGLILPVEKNNMSSWLSQSLLTNQMMSPPVVVMPGLFSLKETIKTQTELFLSLSRLRKQNFFCL